MKRCQNDLGGKSNGKARPSEHQLPSADWNVAVTLAEPTFDEARIPLASGANCGGSSSITFRS
jgi:hypothetical protein